jgi:arginine decarboxylase
MLMVPSHAGTASGLSEDLAAFSGERSLEMDIPQLVDGIDVGPDSPFMRAVALAADAWQARRTWFLANGSSQGNRMAVVAVAGQGVGNDVIAQRSAHSSFIDGMILAGTSPYFLLPNLDLARGINHGLTPSALDAGLQKAIDGGRKPCATYIISPSYFGAVSDISGLAEVAHSRGVPLIVDAAWGAHFGFHPELPEFPTTQGADIVVTSTHKMGGSLGQSAMLHLAEGPYSDVLEPLLDRAYMLTQNTSASSLLLGSLDVARRALMTRQDLLTESIALADRLRSDIRNDTGCSVISDEFSQYDDIHDIDPLRVSIDVSATGMTGYQVRSLLHQEHGILLEIATVSAIVAFLGPGKPLDTGRLLAALQGLPTKLQSVANAFMPRVPLPGERRLSPRDAYFARSEIVPFDSAVGRTSADTLAAYPPGISNVTPGEEITSDTIEFLRAVAASPIGYVRGALDTGVSTFRVLVEPGG